VHFLQLPHLYGAAPQGFYGASKQKLRDVLGSDRSSSSADLRKARMQLSHEARSDRWYLSEDRHLETALSRFHDGLERLKQAIRFG